MRLAALLAELPPDQLDRIAAAHLGEDDGVSPASLCSTLEGVLRSYSFVRGFVCDRFPPTFSILQVLLDANSWAVPAASFREIVAERTKTLVERVTSGELVGRDSSLRLYRRVLLEARRNDLVLDASETAILGVLRRELDIRPVEHFLIEHHSDFHEFWAKEDAFLDEMNALRSCGLVFGHQGNVLLAEEVVPLVRQTLGFEMSDASRRRLFAHFSGGDLTDVLGTCGLKTGGARDEKLDRLQASYVQPTEVLRTLALQTLRDLCRTANASVSGSKDELVERLVERFLYSLDIQHNTEPSQPPPIAAEPRVLSDARFRAMFAALKGDDLTDILGSIDSSRITGAKDTKISLITSSPFCEFTLLEKLTNRALEETLGRLHLRTAGSKRERVERLVEYYLNVPEMLLAPGETVHVAGGVSSVPRTRDAGPGGDPSPS